MHKKIIYILSIIYLVVSCESMDAVKRGFTGEKRKSADEFLIQKKDPLILPPDYENLPIPDERIADIEEDSIFENTLENSIEENSSATDSVENSILKKNTKKIILILSLLIHFLAIHFYF